MATSKLIRVDAGGYRHFMRVWLISQDRTANTSRIGYEYYIERDVNRASGVFNFFGDTDFTTVVDGTTRVTSPTFDFRDTVRITMQSGQQTVTHNSVGAKTVSFSFSSEGMSSTTFVPASGSGSLSLTEIARASQITRVRPNPANEGSAVVIDISATDPGFTNTLSWETETDSGSIGTVTGTQATWTVPTGFLGTASEVPTTLVLETYNGATLVGTDRRDMLVREPMALPEVGAGTPFDFRIRRTELDDGVWVKREIIPVLSASFTDTFSASAACELTISKALYDTDLDRTAVAFEIFDGAQWLDFDYRMLLTRAEADATDLSETVKYSGTSFLEYIFGKGQMPADREFKNTTPGDLLVGVLQAAQNRGWGPYVDFDYTAAKTSLGTAWATNKVSMELKADTPYLQILEGLVDDAQVEYRVEVIDGVPTLRMFNPGTGFDWADEDSATVVNLGLAALTRVASAAPVRKDYANMLTRVRVRGDEATRTRERVAAVDPLLGHLEGSVNATDVKSNTQLDRLGDAALTNQTTPDVERTFSYDLSSTQTPSQLLPYRVFRPGDWILMPGDNGPERTRVAQVALQKDGATVKATVTGGDLIPSGIAAQARKLTQQSSGAIAGGTLRAPSPLAAAIPAAPENLAATSAGIWLETGAAASGVELTWDEVTLSLDGSDVDVELYEIWTRPSTGTPWVSAGISSELSFVVAPLDVNITRQYRVRARAAGNIYGEFSDLVEITTVAPTSEIPALAVAALYTDGLGNLFADWDGALGDLSPVPTYFSFMAAEISPDVAGSPSGSWTVKGNYLQGPGTVTLNPEGFGTWWIRFRAYDVLGNPGVAGTPASITTVDPGLVAPPTPKAPTGLSATAGAGWDALGVTSGDFIALSWTPVTQDTDDDPVTIAYYEVEADDGSGDWVNVLRITGDAYDLSVPRGATYTYRVRAISTAGGVSAWSTSAGPVTANASVVALVAPSIPDASSSKGLLYVEWDGLDENGDPYDNDTGFRYAYAEVALDVAGSPGTWQRAGSAFPGRAGVVVVSGLINGGEYHVRIVVVDGLDTATPGAPLAGIVIRAIDGSDIDPGSILGDNLDPNFADGAVITGALVQTDAAADTGLKLTTGGLVAYDGSGNPTFLLDAASGSVWFGTGTISGEAVDVSTIDVGLLQASLITNGMGDALTIGGSSLVSIISGIETELGAQGTNLATYFDFGAAGQWRSDGDSAVTGLRISSADEGEAFNAFAFAGGFQIRRGSTALSWWEADPESPSVVRFVTPNITVLNDLNVGSHKLRPGAEGVTILSAQ